MLDRLLVRVIDTTGFKINSFVSQSFDIKKKKKLVWERLISDKKYLPFIAQNEAVVK